LQALAGEGKIMANTTMPGADALGIGRLLAQRVQPRNMGPAQSLAINQRGGGGMSVPAGQLPRETGSDQNAQLLQLGGLLGMMGLQDMVGGGDGFSTTAQAAGMMPGFTSAFDSASPSLFGGAMSGAGAGASSLGFDMPYDIAALDLLSMFQ
jgi:hypothetical protein